MADDHHSSNSEPLASANDSPESNLARTNNSASRRAVWMVIGGVMLAIAGVAVAITLFVDPIPPLTDARLQKAEERWQRAGPASYDMNLEIRGAQPGKVHIEVRNGEVTAMTRDGHSPPERTWDTWTVPGQFETLERELVMEEDPEHEMQVQAGTQFHARAEFDPQYGYPRRYHRYVSGGGPEVFWQVTNFQPK